LSSALLEWERERRLAVTDEHSFAAQQGVWSYLQADAYSRSRSQGVRPDTTATFTIAISREAGINAGAYARAMGEELGWQVWDHELLNLIAKRLGSEVTELELLDERHISWIQESLEAFLSVHALNQHVFVRHLQEVMQNLAARGDCIIVGRGAPHILPPKTTLRVRLVAPLGERVTAFQRQMGIADAWHATRELEKIDRERVRFVNEHFHRDSVDPTAYDVVLNVSRFSHNDCMRLVLDLLQAIKHRQVRARKCSDAAISKGAIE
jgi:cytidylate kinase